MHEHHPVVTNEWTIDDPACNHLITMAEREFVAFTRAVTELFGAEQASLSAEDWLNEVVSKERLPGPTSPEWRVVTMAALARLAIRMTVALHFPHSIHPPIDTNV